MDFKLKNDRYRSARGGEAHLFDLSCSRCSAHVLTYQKDGRGNLVRCYLNRIFHPEHLERLQHLFTAHNYKQLPNLHCSGCGELLGTPMLYADGRVAYLMRHGKFAKKRIF